MSALYTDADLIQKLGGCASVGRDLNRTTKSVYHWTTRGISWPWRARVAALAQSRGVAVPGDFLTRGSE